MSLSEQREKDKVGPRMSRLTPEREAMLRKHIQSDDVEYGSVVLSVENCNLLLAEIDALRAEKNKYHDQWYSEAKRGEEERGKLLAELDRVRAIANNNAKSCEGLSDEIDRLRADYFEMLKINNFNADRAFDLETERDSLREKLQAEYQNNKIDKLNIESADDRYEILYQITHEEIDELKEKITMALEALIHSTQKHEYCALIEEAIEKIRGEKC